MHAQGSERARVVMMRIPFGGGPTATAARVARVVESSEGGFALLLVYFKTALSHPSRTQVLGIPPNQIVCLESVAKVQVVGFGVFFGFIFFCFYVKTKFP